MARQEEPKAINQPLVENPQTGEDFYQRGWQYYAREEHALAIEDFFRALQFTPEQPDILYALGLALQASGQNEEAIKAFQRTLTSLKNLPDKTRASMLSRMARGHINRIRTGDWNIDSEELI
jgi:tetratricopeptide (TPR) repeat protein